MQDKTDSQLNKRLKTLTAAKANAPVFGVRKSDGTKKGKRSDERAPSFRVGRVIYSGRNEVACVIKDISGKGAKITLEGEAALPPDVCLCISQTGQRRQAKVIWQQEREAGLCFDMSGEC